ncbi:hypothetical protein PIB30_057914 [Stylosanthes scabra]|uniref:Uncharacterized protein n=1 Tax=Stylosanthes scabra TaxID=79078 RepID=A0ABU6QJ98_9FABA|nr:hypothetical protein [Stylosanthes scabra]
MYKEEWNRDQQARVKPLSRLAGFGLKAFSRPLSASNHGKRCWCLLIMRYYGMLPCTLWLAVAVGYMPRPEVLGRVIDRQREHFVPKYPINPSDVVFPYPSMWDFLEWSLYQGWMQQYLAYLQWYCTVPLDPFVSVDKSTPNRLYSFSAPCFFVVGVNPVTKEDRQVLSWSLGIRVVGFEMQQAQSTTAKERELGLDSRGITLAREERYQISSISGQKISACRANSETEEHRRHEAST